MRSCTYQDHQLRWRCTECGIPLDLCNCVEVNDCAQRRLWSEDGKTFRAIRGELQQARRSFPGTRYMLSALAEEVGELNQAMMEHSRGENRTAAEIYNEAIQVAAMAIRIAVEGDSDFDYEPYAIFGEETLSV